METLRARIIKVATDTDGQGEQTDVMVYAFRSPGGDPLVSVQIQPNRFYRGDVEFPATEYQDTDWDGYTDLVEVGPAEKTITVYLTKGREV